MAAHYELRIYGDDGTLLSSASTDPAHVRPYLDYPTDFGESRADFLRGDASIGEVTLYVLDKRTTATDQDTGWFTALLSDNDLGNLKAELARIAGATERIVVGGVLGDRDIDGAELVGYTVQLRDAMERTREVPAFLRTDTATVLPRGVMNGYGGITRRGGSKHWMIPPTEPLLAKVSYWRGDITLDWAIALLQYTGHTNDLDALRYTQAQLDLGMPRWSEDRNRYDYPDLVLMWRPEGGTTWTEIENPRALENDAGPEFTGFWHYNEERKLISSINIRETDGTAPPADGSIIEIIVRYNGPPSDEYPLHIEGITVGRFLKNVYDGVYSDRDPGIEYDANAVLALDRPIRALITEPVDDIRDSGWLAENLYAPLGAAPVVIEGKISPVVYYPPGPDVTLPELNATNIYPDETAWGQASSEAVNAVRFEYGRDVPVTEADDPDGSQGGGDRIATRPIERIYPDEGEVTASISRNGYHEIAYRTALFRAQGNSRGQPLSGDSMNEAGTLLAAQRIRQVLDMYEWGTEHYVIEATDADAAGLTPGSWVQCSVPWLPNVGTGTRGLNRVAMVESVTPVDEQTLRLRLLDGGPNLAPLAQPTIGVLTENADGSISVPISTVPAGAEARVDYILSDTAPSTSDEGWVTAGREPAGASVTIPPVPAGSIVWVIYRSEQANRRPSGWGGPTDITVTDKPVLTFVSVSLDENGAPTVYTEYNPATKGLRIKWAVHAAGEDNPTLTQSADYEAAETLTLSAVTVEPGEAITVEVTPWTLWDATNENVDGAAGTSIRRTRARGGEVRAFGQVTASIGDDGAGFFDFSGDDLARSFAWKASKASNPTDPTGATVEDAQSGHVSIPTDQIIVGEGEKLYVTGWFFDEAAGAGERGPPVYTEAPRGGRGPQGPPGEAIGTTRDLINFRVVEETDTYRRYAWERGADVARVFIYEMEHDIPGPDDPWPTSGQVPNKILKGGEDTWTLYYPDANKVRRAQFEPRTSDLLAGPIRRVEMYPPGLEPPFFEYVRQVQQPGYTSHVYGSLNDPVGLTGTLKVWVNPDGKTSPDPTALPDGSVGVASLPFAFGPTTAFDVGGEATDTLLANIPYRPGSTKHVYLEFVASDDRTTGAKGVALEDLLDLVSEVGELRAGSIINAEQFASGIDPVLVLSSVPAAHAGSDVIVVGGKLYRWDGAAYTAAVPTSDLTGTIATTQLADGSVTTVKIGSAAVTTTKLGDGSITEAKIGSAAVTEAKIGGGAVTTAKIGSLSVTSEKLADGSIGKPKFSTNLRPVERVTALPALPSASYPEGIVVYLTGDAKLYRSTGSAWTKAVDGADLVANSVTANAITAGTITAAEIASGTITATEIAAGAIVATKIATDAVVAAKIAAGAVVASKIATDAVVASKIAAGAITTAKLDANAVTAAKIAAGAVVAEAVAAGAITTVKLDASAVTTAKLAADSVTAAKLAAITMEVGKHIQSSGYTAGSAGWRINGAGDAEFNDVVIRGTLDGATGSFAGELSAASGTFSGTVTIAGGDSVDFHAGGESVGRLITEYDPSNPTGAARSISLDVGGVRMWRAITIAGIPRDGMDVNIAGVGLRRLRVGAPDSGGSGYRIVRVNN